MKTVYAVGIEAHESFGVDVGAICWGSCGKGSIGGIGMDEMGSAIPCFTAAAECPHHVKDSGPFGTIDHLGGEEMTVVLRRIQSPTPTPAEPVETKG
jgi:hypothetical protein